MKRIKVAMLAFLLAFGLTLIGCGNDDSPSGVAKEYFSAVKKGDAKKIEATATKKTAELLAKFMSDESMKKEIASVDDFVVTEETINGDKATVKGTAKRNGKEEKMDFKLVKEDDKWKVTLGK